MDRFARVLARFSVVLLVLFVASTDLPAVCDLTDLFASPTPTEIDSVATEWTARNPVVVDWTVHADGIIGGHRVMVVSHTVDADTHYAAVRFPLGTPNCPHPVLVYAHGGSGGVGVSAADTLEAYLPGSLVDDSLIVLLPSFRGETLHAGPFGSFISGGTKDQHDEDADDAMALLDGVLSNIPEADPHRVMVWGISRGGNTALHMGIRDSRVKTAVSFFPASDFFTPAMRDSVDSAINGGSSPSMPPVRFAADSVAQPFCDAWITLEEARHKLLLYSAAYWPEDMTRLQLHHGTADTQVAFEQSVSLNAAMVSTGVASPFYEFYVYPGGTHSLSGLPGSEIEVRRFILSVFRPLVIANGCTLTTTGTGDSYQWRRNGVPIPGAIDPVYVPSVSGAYSVVFTTTGGCTFSSVSLAFSPVDVPRGFSVFDAKLEQNRPNPFNPATELRFVVQVEGWIELAIHDVAGRLVTTLVDQHVAPGSHSALWDGRYYTGAEAASGVYFARLKAGSEVWTRKVTLTR